MIGFVNSVALATQIFQRLYKTMKTKDMQAFFFGYLANEAGQLATVCRVSNCVQTNCANRVGFKKRQ